jgi:pimeloyl-ACP methyl ester carboxylesterase
LIAASAGCAALQARGQEGGLLRLGTPAVNLGGFSDEIIFRGWRVQRHSTFGHYRLVDPAGNIQARGTFETCRDAFEKAKADHQLQPLPKRVVVVLHGLGATSGFMEKMCDYFREQGELHVVNITYASTREEIPSYAKSLDSVIRHLDGAEQIDFVAHSMGNIVVRRYLGDLARLTPEMRPKVKFGRFVMISPPNHGAEIADMVAGNNVLKAAAELLAGEPVKELAPGNGWPALEQTLAVPDFEFGIIAGGRGDDEGYLSQVPGDDDGLLSVETMKLAGARDFVQVEEGVHQLMPKYKQVREMALNFLEHGYFFDEKERQPIAAAN